MHAVAVETLVTRANLSPPEALAVAEAIEMSIGAAQLVTVPVFNARLEVFEARFNVFESRLDAKYCTLEAKFNAFAAQMEARFSAFASEMEAKFSAFEARVDAKLSRQKFELVFWMIAVTVGNTYLPKLTAAIEQAISAMFH